jgi:hypothetical protein
LTADACPTDYRDRWDWEICDAAFAIYGDRENAFYSGGATTMKNLEMRWCSNFDVGDFCVGDGVARLPRCCCDYGFSSIGNVVSGQTCDLLCETFGEKETHRLGSSLQPQQRLAAPSADICQFRRFPRHHLIVEIRGRGTGCGLVRRQVSGSISTLLCSPTVFAHDAFSALFD